MEPRKSLPARAPAFTELDEAECYRLLGDSGVGRIAVCLPDGPIIVPVNYLVDDQSILVGTSPRTVLARHASGPAAFEVDELEPALKFGWSVLVVGQAEPVEDVDEMIELRASERLQAWAGCVRNLFIRITPREVTGREIS